MLIEQKKKLDELNREMAREAWKLQHEATNKSRDHTIQIGLAALRAPVLLNSAGLGAILAFVSSQSGKLGSAGDAIAQVYFSYLVGVFLGATATGFGYLWMRASTNATNSYEKVWQARYVQSKYSVSQVDQDLWQIATIAAVVLSYIAFIRGGYLMYTLLLAILGK